MNMLLADDADEDEVEEHDEFFCRNTCSQHAVPSFF